MEFAILGPVRVLLRGEPVRVGGPRERKVLAALLLRAGHLVRTEFLIEVVWGETPPATARAQVYNSIATLRRALAQGEDADKDADDVRIEGERGGFVLFLGTSTLDAARFEQALAAADELIADGGRTQATDVLREALSWWRGGALEGVGSVALGGEAHRLDEARLEALERRIGIDLESGQLRDLVGELGALTHAHPLRESLIGLLMQVLYRTGRQADALAAYRDCRTRLREELGVEPGPELSRLHEQILRADPSLSAGSDAPEAEPAEPEEIAADAEKPVPRQLPAGIGHFTGREEILAALDAVLAADAAAPVVALTGSAGIGKTATAVHWAASRAARFPDGCLYVNLQGFDPVGPPLPPQQALRGFLTALGVAREQIPGATAEQIGLYRSLLADRRVLVVLDNARRADQVRPLLPAGSNCLTLVTSRDRLTGLAAVDGAHTLPLDLLTLADAVELLRRRIGPDRADEEPAALDELVQLCARLPLALNIAAARIAERPQLAISRFVARMRGEGASLAALDAGDPVACVRAVFDWTYRQLDASAARLFRRLGMHPGPEAGVDACTALLGGDEADTLAALDQLVGLHLLEESSAPERYTAHDLLHAFAAELCREQEGEEGCADLRVLLFDHYLHSAHAAELLLQPGRPPIDLTPAHPGSFPVAHADADAAMRWFETETEVLVSCVGVAPALGLDQHLWQLAWAATTFLDRSGRHLELLEMLDGALEALERLGDVDGRIRTHIDLGMLLGNMRSPAEARRHLNAALELAGRNGDDPHTQGRATLVLARMGRDEGSYDEALKLALEAIGLFRKAERPVPTAFTLEVVASVSRALGDHPQALRSSEEALAILREPGVPAVPVLEADLHQNVALTRLDLGETALALVHQGEALEIYRRLGERVWTAEAHMHLGDIHAAAGEPDQAGREWERSLELYRELEHPAAEQVRSRLSGVR